MSARAQSKRGCGGAVPMAQRSCVLTLFAVPGAAGVLEQNVPTAIAAGCFDHYFRKDTPMTALPNRAAALCAALAATLIAPAALAADEGTIVQASSERRVALVSYADLNLANEKGVERLRTRVRMAAHSVCGVDLAFGLGPRIDAQGCKAAAIADANRQIATVLAHGARLASVTTITVAAD
jgi:UrcA family protein